MIYKINDEQIFQVLSSSFTIGPSETGYELQVGATSRDFSTLFSVGANTPRMVTNVANGSYFRLLNNVGEVEVNWSRTCKDGGGGGASGTELSPVSEFPLGAEAGTVVAYNGTASASGVYQYTGEEWVAVGVDDLSSYWTSAQTEDAISAATSGKADAASVSANTNTSRWPAWNSQGVITGTVGNIGYETSLTVNGTRKWLWANPSGPIFGTIYAPTTPGTAGDILVSTGSGAPVWSAVTFGGNSNILAAITTDEEYEAISGSVKTGDLIQVWDVDINDDGDNEFGLFQADVPEPGVLNWYRRDNQGSLNWADKDYPWMADNGVWPVDIGIDAFLISPDSGEGFNGIGFDGDGNPVLTHIVPEYDDQTGEITGMTREDTPIGGGLPVGYEAADQYAVTENYQIVTVDGKVFGEDLYDIPAFHTFENGYSDEERGYVIGNWCYVFGYYDEDDNFVPVFLPAGTYAILNTDDGTDNYGKVLNLFYGKVGDEDVIYNGDGWIQQLDSISLVSPLFTIAEPTCPTTEDNYYELYLDYTDKPSAQSQIDVLDEVVSTALVDLNDKKVESEDIKRMVKLTQAEYDDLVDKDPETFYIIISNNN